MAHMLMASSSTKSLTHLTTTTTTATTTPSTPKLKPQFQLLKLPHLPPPLKSLTTTALTTTLPLLLPHPSLAIEIEKAALFDFNLTLPIIMAEFLLLMWALDKVYFTPLGDFMDQRDASIKDKLADVKDTSSEVKELDEQANAIMRAARAEISSALSQMRKETQVEVEAKLVEGRKKVEGELLEALENLEKQKEETIMSLDDQISALSDEIVKKVLPVS